MTEHHDTSPAPERALDLRITTGSQIGFVVWEAGEVTAALTTPQELADWIEQRLRSLPGEAERADRLAEFIAHMRAAPSNVTTMPRFVREHQGHEATPTPPSRVRSWLGG